MRSTGVLARRITWFWLAFACSCGDPCRDLSETVCRCAPSRDEQQRCLRRVRTLARDSKSSTQQQQACVAALETCSCEALAVGDLNACGLADD